VPGGRKGKRGPRTDNRRFLNALLWMARSGGPWRDLPRRFGKHESVRRLYYRWTVRNLVCGAVVTPMEGAYGNQERHPGRFASGA
jgi:transposase